jgi:hypothetical protein
VNSARVGSGGTRSRDGAAGKGCHFFLILVFLALISFVIYKDIFMVSLWKIVCHYIPYRYPYFAQRYLYS